MEAFVMTSRTDVDTLRARPVRVAHVATVDLTHRFLLLGQLRRLRDEGFDVTAISGTGPWVREIEAAGIRFIPWPHATRSWNLRADALAFLELLAILRRERFDVVHSHNPKPGVLARLAARAIGVPCVVNTVHGLYATPDDRFLKRVAVLAIERLAARMSDLELYQSAEDFDWARRVGVVGEDKSALLGNGCDLKRFAPSIVTRERVLALRAELGFAEDSLVVGTVGRLVAEKGYREFVEAARLVRRAIPDVSFLGIGGSDLGKRDAIGPEEIERARGDVLFVGWRDDLPELLAVMDVFVLASRREGVPRAAIEAAAMGKPLVVTDVRGCREVVRQGTEGILVPAGDATQLADALIQLLTDSELRERMGIAARARVIESFDEAVVAERLVQHYQELLFEKGIAPGKANRVRIRPARMHDARALARLHREALPDAFLPALGDRFLRCLYRAAVKDAEAVTVVAEDGSEIVGFASGVLSVRRFYRRFMLHYGVVSAAVAAPRLLNPKILRKAWETARYGDLVGSLPESELLSIAVSERVRSRGLGAELARRVLRGLAEQGANEIRVVMGSDNEGARRFYERMGFRPRMQVSLHDGRPSNVYVIRCRSSSPSLSLSS
jgi:glycosyltransferase involved in cell wall biosynthesis/ribosomal protein S18 acetylase RimI-like enzyme